ncbi:M28 family peptidase [Paracidobacterium acidisoli]|uniref:M28 family peptidase n=1 Tax=Paracidobacterium acidisoli TaxID=2303751 RepID=UPI00207AF767|nr:M28 family peptidase [Paracidobacterium acidisoli]
MNSRKFLLLILSATAAVIACPAQVDSPDAAAQWWSHVSYLASDALAGRRTGTADFVKAAEYLQAQFKAAGLSPAGASGYLQDVGFEEQQIDNAASRLDVVYEGQAVSLPVGSAAILSPYAGPDTTVDAPAVFAGYGFAVPVQHFDDLSGVDVKGKIAVVLAGSPPSVHGPLRAYFRTAAERWKQLRAAGAVGVITIQEPRPQNAPAGPRPGEGPRPTIRLASPELNPLAGNKLSATVPIAAADALFAHSGHTLSDLEAQAEAGKELPKFSLNVTIHAHTAVKQFSQFTAPNVAGVLEGSDRRLKKEYIVLSAHLDHLGKGRPVNGDDIYNGAMDNATGIASLIEVAKQLAAGPRPKRSILFLALTGEEEGELGSQYFAQFPTVPRAQIVADLNMDMYLPLFPLRYLEVQGLGESSLGNDVRAVAQLNDVEVQFDKQPDQNRFIRSDQASFVKHGIPALAFKFGWVPDSPEEKTFNDWIKNRYHKPSDDLEQPVDKNAAVLFDRILGQLALRVANAKERPAWYPESFFASIPRS